uniref:Dehydrogenase reductase SDR member 7B n=1 Tax=Sphaerodactylus townsendi TaxID=933632 RepID=A0ACB8FMN2_9SAUR
MALPLTGSGGSPGLHPDVNSVSFERLLNWRDGSQYGVMDKTTSQGQGAAEVAQEVLSAVGKRKKEVLVAGLTPSLAVYLRMFFPRLFFTLMAARARKERKAKES